MFSLSRRFTRTSTAAVTSSSSSILLLKSSSLLVAENFSSSFLMSSMRHNSNQSADAQEINDVANCFRMAQSNRIPLGKVIHGVPPGTKTKIFKSGKGLEGYLRQFPSAFAIEKVGNDKFLLLVDERLREAGSGGNEEKDSNNGTSDATATNKDNNNKNNISAPGDISGMVCQRIRPPPSEKSLRRMEFRKMQQEKYEKKNEQREREMRDRDVNKNNAPVASSSSTASGGSQMWVDE